MPSPKVEYGPGETRRSGGSSINWARFDEAVAAAAKRAGLEDGKYERDYLESDKSWAQELVASVETSATSLMLRVAGPTELGSAWALQAPSAISVRWEREVLRFNRHAIADRL